MSRVKIYTTDYCPFCIRAKQLLDSKGISFDEVNLQNDPMGLQKLKEETKMMTVPQIFIGEKLIGGYQELVVLNQSGELEKLIKA